MKTEEYGQSRLYSSGVIIHIKVFTLSRLHLEKTPSGRKDFSSKWWDYGMPVLSKTTSNSRMTKTGPLPSRNLICYHLWSTCSVPRTIQNALHVWFLLLTHQRHGPGILSPIIQSKKLGHRRVRGFVIMKQLRCNAEKLSPVGLPSKLYFH